MANISVTPINMEPPTPPTTNGGPAGEPPLDSSDAEVAQIDFQSGVHMRHKKRPDDATTAASAPLDNPGTPAECIPRPMSWEGELSDGEHDDMCVDDEHHGSPENLSMHHHHHQVSATAAAGIAHSTQMRLKQQQQQHHAPPPPPPTNYSLHSTPNNSPLLSQRHVTTSSTSTSTSTSTSSSTSAHPGKALNVPPTPSPDSAVHSAYSVFSSPTQSPLTQRHVTLTPNLSRNNSDASHSSCCSYSSVSVSVSPTQQFSPTHSPIQGRHMPSIHHGSPLHHNVLYRSLQEDSNTQFTATSSEHDNDDSNPLLLAVGCDDKSLVHAGGGLPTAATSGISRQQLINSPCPICGDKISGFHYGIFSCESCKGFFKRTVQNRKNYVCLRGAVCPVTVATRKKCPACRFEKCLQCGMKLEAIREDRTRGGRSTYQCSYSLPPSLTAGVNMGGGSSGELRASTTDLRAGMDHHSGVFGIKLEPTDMVMGGSGSGGNGQHAKKTMMMAMRHGVPPLLQEIMDVEHLWHYNELELNKLSTEGSGAPGGGGGGGGSSAMHNLQMHPLLAGTALAGSTDTNPDFIANLCNIADHRLYKIVKWCKSLPLFKNISIDDQICLLINSWCELLLFSCCFRSMATPGEIRVSLGKSITLAQARDLGMQTCIERMLNFTDHLRRLRVDRYEYVAMKVIVLLTSDTSELREAEKVRASQEKALKALQDYTLSHYPEAPAKFGELLLRIPELQRTCQVGKEMLTIKTKNDEGPSFNLLLELLRGDH